MLRTGSILLLAALMLAAPVRSFAAAPSRERPRIIPPTVPVPGYNQGLAGTAPLSNFVHLRGQRINHLRGIGIVTGLDNTGDNQMALFSIQLVLNTLKKEGVTLPPNLLTSPLMIMANDLASVTITADMPSSARKGDRLDVNVAAMGNATSLQGGTLLMAPLKGADNRVYAVAQGPVSIAGYFAGAAGASVKTNFQTAGQVAGGATIERELADNFSQSGTVELDLNDPDALMAEDIANAIRNNISDSMAVVKSPGMIDVSLPSYTSTASLAASLRRVRFNPPQSDRVVVNEKTGTVVVGGDVTIGKSAVSYGDYTITIAPQLQVSQPNPFGNGRTVALRTAR
ncbi:MAG: flagellar basal body P-ring protein FlgI, partial [Candidatus Binataceae bacterium]